MKKQDKVIEFLKQKGCKEVESKSRKYRKFSRSTDEKFYFVGRNGALRAGKNISKSISLTNSVNKKI